MKPLFCMVAINEHKKKKPHHCSSFFTVGIPGFEPGTPCSQSRCANRTALHPECYIYASFLKSDAKIRLIFESANFPRFFFKKSP